MTTIQVRYIGVKPKQTDCIAGTGTVWNGPGDVKTVPIKAWEQFRKHPTVYELVEGEAQSQPSSNKTLADADTPPDLNAMDRDALFALAVKRELNPHHKAGKAKLIEMLEA